MGRLHGEAEIDEAKLKKKIIKHLKLREGVRYDVYKDSLGKLTVGVGHLVVPGDKLSYGDRVSKSAVNRWLEQDTIVAYAAARRQAEEIGIVTEDFLVALTSVNFQLGTRWTKKFRTSYPALVRGDYEVAIKGISNSLWSEQTPTRTDDFIAAIKRAFKDK